MKKRQRKPLLPHHAVYTRIQRSKLHGVGVFAVINIPKGTKVFQGEEDEEILWFQKRALKLNRLPKAVRALYQHFCLIQDNGEKYGCPRSFNRMTTSWYLNHSKKPNIGSDPEFNFFALRKIKAGEELTVDYDTYNKFAKSGSPTGL